MHRTNKDFKEHISNLTLRSLKGFRKPIINSPEEDENDKIDLKLINQEIKHRVKFQ